MEEKQICKWLRRRFTQVGWTLVVYYGILNVLVMAAAVSDGAKQAYTGSPGGIDPEALMNNASGYLAAIAVGLVILYGWKGQDYFPDTLAKRRGSMGLGTFAALLSLCLGAQVLNGLWVAGLEWVMNRFDRSVMELMESVSGYSDSFGMFLYVCFLGPISEELLFRGYVLRTLEPFGKRFAIVCSALLFGLFHGNLLQGPYAFAMGLILGYMAAEYSVFWSMGMHVFNNFVLADLLTRLEEVLPAAGQTGINVLFLLGSLAAIGILLANRTAIRAYREEKMDRRCLKCFFTNSGVIVLTGMMLISMAVLL